MVEFYRLFLRTPTFAAWLREHSDSVYRSWRYRALAALSAMGAEGKQQEVQEWAVSKGEVEVVELLLRLRDEVAAAELKCDAFAELSGVAESIASSLPLPSMEGHKNALSKKNRSAQSGVVSSTEREDAAEEYLEDLNGDEKIQDSDNSVAPSQGTDDYRAYAPHDSIRTRTSVQGPRLPANPSPHRNRMLEHYDLYPTPEQLKNMRRAIQYVVFALPDSLRMSVVA
ncbi:hypothetical protein HDU93_001450 [Gonapodya sp. JEL0774]|nr:hypothetical protein HDU93_001450 [Gonapodya sp. JEL0774]